MAPRGDPDRDYEACKMMREDELVILEVSIRLKLLLFLGN
jgi:hypothetical protein